MAKKAISLTKRSAVIRKLINQVKKIERELDFLYEVMATAVEEE